MKKSVQRVMVFGLSILLLTTGQSGLAANKKPALNMTKLALKVGETKKLTVKNVSQKVKWSTSNKKVATVSEKGVVKAKKKGTARITATVAKKKYTCKVTVNNESDKPAVSDAPAVPEDTEPTAKPEETLDPDWENGKKSGSKEDFEKYFKVTLSDYTKKKDVAQGRLEEISYSSKVIGEERKANVYLPAGYTSDKQYPVVYMIHGIGCDKGQWVGLSMANIINNMIASGEVGPFVAVLPSVIPSADHMTPGNALSAENIKAFSDFKEEFTQDLEPYIRSHYSVSEKREETAVCGLSMGGMEALILGFSMLDHFNYIGSFSPAPTLDTSLLTLENSKNKPALIMVCNGDADNTVGDVPKDYHNVLMKNEVDHIWYQYPKGNHETKVWQNGLINFLKRVKF